MKALVGDELVVHSHHVGEPDRSGEILEVRGTEGQPPYVVRWDEDGHQSLVYPGSDAEVVSTHH